MSDLKLGKNDEGYAFKISMTKDGAAFPDNTYDVYVNVVDKDGSFVKSFQTTYYADGDFRYTLQSGDLNFDGSYDLQIQIKKTGYQETIPEYKTLEVQEDKSS